MATLLYCWLFDTTKNIVPLVFGVIHLSTTFLISFLLPILRLIKIPNHSITTCLPEAGGRLQVKLKYDGTMIFQKPKIMECCHELGFLHQKYYANFDTKAEFAV